MLLKRVSLLILIVGILLATGCSLDSGIDTSEPVQDEGQRTILTNYVTVSNTVTISAPDYAFTSSIFPSILNGSFTYTYVDGCYTGVVHSTSYSILSGPSIVYQIPEVTIVQYTLLITYEGTVTCNLACENEPASKVVSVTVRQTISAPTYAINTAIASATSSTNTYSYDSECFSGSLPYSNYTTISGPTVVYQNPQITIVQYVIDITYIGTVYKK